MNVNEKISSLMDGELSEIEVRQVLGDMSRDPDQRAAWDRYQVARAALRNELPAPLATQTATAVMKRIGDGDSQRRRRIGNWMGTGAIAATVAAVALISVQWLRAPEPVGTTASAVARAPAEKVAAARSRIRWNVNRPEAEKTLNAYLVEHSEFASGSVGGLLPYVHTVGYDKE